CASAGGRWGPLGRPWEQEAREEGEVHRGGTADLAVDLDRGHPVGLGALGVPGGSPPASLDGRGDPGRLGGGAGLGGGALARRAGARPRVAGNGAGGGPGNRGTALGGWARGGGTRGGGIRGRHPLGGRGGGARDRPWTRRAGRAGFSLPPSRRE